MNKKKQRINFDCDSELAKAFDAKIANHLSRTEAFIVLMKMIVAGALVIDVDYKPIVPAKQPKPIGVA